MRFSVGSVEVELVIEIVKKAGAEASIKVLNLLSLGGKGDVSKADTHRVKVTLNPIDVGGEPFEIASAQTRRPDAGEEGSDVRRSDAESAPSSTGSRESSSVGPGG